MMYASKITINSAPQKIAYHRAVELPEGLLTLNDISKHLKDEEKFGFREVSSQFGTVLFMEIHGFRLETQEELVVRIAKQEKYNENYEKHHKKYAK